MEYRMPLFRLQRGPGTLPFFLNSAHFSLFADVGDAFNRGNPSFRPLLGLGAEIRGNFVVGWHLPVMGRLGYGIIVTNRDRIAGARPDFASPVSRGSLCVKGQFGWEFVHSADRLTTPLVRKDGELRPASWDEALDLVAGRLTAVRETSGPDAAVFWSSARATCEANYVFQKLARAAVGTNNIDNCART
jgi:hypothetical protein